MSQPEQQPWYLPQDIYDELMTLPEGTDITDWFEFEPGWNLTVTKGSAPQEET